MHEILLIANITLLSAMALRLVPALTTRRGWYALGLIVTSAAYFLSWYLSVTDVARALRLILFIFVISQPVFFWLTANALFDDRFRVRWWHLVIIAGKFVVAGLLIAGGALPNIFTNFATADLPRIIPNFFYTLAFVFHALAVIMRTNRGDLVEPRRRLRAVVLIVTGLLIVQALLSAAVLRPLGWGAVSDTIALCLVNAASLASVAWGQGFWQQLFPAAEKRTDTVSADPLDMQKALDAMEKHELFRTEGLTVKMLAEKLGLQEYKLRRAINAGLGYRNFNEFLNFYRMRAAKRFLENAQNRDYPLIHLALDLGYPSPAPFNRAFKDATGFAPGEYRRKQNSKAATGHKAEGET